MICRMFNLAIVVFVISSTVHAEFTFPDLQSADMVVIELKGDLLAEWNRRTHRGNAPVNLSAILKPAILQQRDGEDNLLLETYNEFTDASGKTHRVTLSTTVKVNRLSIHSQTIHGDVAATNQPHPGHHRILRPDEVKTIYQVQLSDPREVNLQSWILNDNNVAHPHTL